MTTVEEEGAKHTLYINNLNEKIKLDTLKAELLKLCEPHGKVLEIIARNTLRTRGQAFIVFEQESAAAQAKAALEGKDFHGKAMRVAFARTKSDPIAKLDGTLEERRTRRNILKERRIAEEKINKRAEKRARREVEAAISSASSSATAQSSVPMRFQTQIPGSGMPMPPQMRPPMMPVMNGAGMPQPFTAGGFGAETAAPSGSGAAAANAKTSTSLFLDNLPTEMAVEDVKNMMKSLGVGDQLKMCQMVPAKPGLAFIEYENSTAAANAVEKLNGHAVDNQHVLKAMYAA